MLRAVSFVFGRVDGGDVDFVAGAVSPAAYRPADNVPILSALERHSRSCNWGSRWVVVNRYWSYPLIDSSEVTEDFAGTSRHIEVLPPDGRLSWAWHWVDRRLP